MNTCRVFKQLHHPSSDWWCDYIRLCVHSLLVCLFTVTAWEKDSLSFPKQQQIYHGKYLPFTFRVFRVSPSWLALSIRAPSYQRKLILWSVPRGWGVTIHHVSSVRCFFGKFCLIPGGNDDNTITAIITMIGFCFLGGQNQSGQQFSKWSTCIQRSWLHGFGQEYVTSGPVWETVIRDEMRHETISWRWLRVSTEKDKGHRVECSVTSSASVWQVDAITVCHTTLYKHEVMKCLSGLTSNT